MKNIIPSTLQLCRLFVIFPEIYRTVKFGEYIYNAMTSFSLDNEDVRQIVY